MLGRTPSGCSSQKTAFQRLLGGDRWQEVHGLEQPLLPASLRKYFTSLTSRHICSSSICLPAELGRIRPLVSECPDAPDTQSRDKQKTPL